MSFDVDFFFFLVFFVFVCVFFWFFVLFLPWDHCATAGSLYRGAAGALETAEAPATSTEVFLKCHL